MEQTLTLEGKSYVIRRLTAKQKHEVLQAFKDQGEFESNVLAVKYSLVSPPLTDEQIAQMDAPIFDFINYKIGELNSVMPFLEKHSQDTSSAATKEL